MAKVIRGIGKLLSGSIDNLVFVQRGGETYVRIKPYKRKPGEWSEKQKTQRECFKNMVMFAATLNEPLIKPIWNKASPAKMNGFNFFLKINKPAFDAAGRLADPGLLRLSTGPLPLPFHMKIDTVPIQNGKITVSWTNQSNNTLRLSDQLIVLFYANNQVNGPFSTGATRDKELALITPPEYIPTESYIYLFFESSDQTLYSEDLAFKIGAIN